MKYNLEVAKKKEAKKRVKVVSLRVTRGLEKIREGSIDYLPRRVSSPEDAVGLFRKVLDNKPREHMYLICLNTKNEFNNISQISMGNINSSIADPKEIYKVALLSNSNSILICHNHPSGDPEPSNDDIGVTRRIEEAGKILGIRLLDHIILGEDGKFVSLKERGIL